MKNIHDLFVDYIYQIDDAVLEFQIDSVNKNDNLCFEVDFINLSTEIETGFLYVC